MLEGHSGSGAAHSASSCSCSRWPGSGSHRRARFVGRGRRPGERGRVRGGRGGARPLLRCTLPARRPPRARLCRAVPLTARDGYANAAPTRDRIKAVGRRPGAVAERSGARSGRERQPGHHHRRDPEATIAALRSADIVLALADVRLPVLEMACEPACRPSSASTASSGRSTRRSRRSSSPSFIPSGVM